MKTREVANSDVTETNGKQKQKRQKEESVKYTHIINMNPNINKKVHNQKKKYTQSQINRCEITIKVMNSRGKHETEHKPWKYRHTYMHS